MIFEEVLGHERARGVLARILSGERVPHAILLHGPEGIGKRLLAERLAASLLCEAPRAGTGEACGACAACRKAAHGNHPDLFVVTRLPKKERAAGAALVPSGGLPDGFERRKRARLLHLDARDAVGAAPNAPPGGVAYLEHDGRAARAEGQGDPGSLEARSEGRLTYAERRGADVGPGLRTRNEIVASA